MGYYFCPNQALTLVIDTDVSWMLSKKGEGSEEEVLDMRCCCLLLPWDERGNDRYKLNE